MSWDNYYPPAQELTDEEIEEELNAELEKADIAYKLLKGE
jgi:hypothetical protein